MIYRSEIVEHARCFARRKRREERRDQDQLCAGRAEAIEEILVQFGHQHEAVITSVHICDLVRAGWVTIEEVTVRFGPQTAGIVGELTRRRVCPFEGADLQEALHHCRRMSREAALVVLADCLHRTRNLDRRAPRTELDSYVEGTLRLLDLLAEADPAMADQTRTLCERIREEQNANQS